MNLLVSLLYYMSSDSGKLQYDNVVSLSVMGQITVQGINVIGMAAIDPAIIEPNRINALNQTSIINESNSIKSISK